MLVHGRDIRPSRLALSLAVNGAVPAVAYGLLRAPLNSDLAALVIGAAVPVVWSAALAAWRRRIDPVALFALAGLGIALVVSLASGGGTLPLLLRHTIVTGVAGLACLVSVLVGRPLLAVVRPLLLRATLRRPSDVDRRRYFAVLTVIVGVVLLAHAAVNVALALSLPTGRYLVVSRVVGWAITAVGAAVVIAYLKLVRGRELPATPADRPEA